MKHNEHDASRALSETAGLRAAPETDPLEQTQRMPVADRRYRMVEGRCMHENARGEGHARAMLNNPVYNSQETAAGMRKPMEPDVYYRARVWYAHASSRSQFCTQTDIDGATGYTLDLLGEKYGVLREPLQGYPDFRDGRREYTLTSHEIAQQDEFPGGDT